VPRGNGEPPADLSDAFADPEADPFERAAEAELSAERRAALGRLKPDERTALLLLGLGCSYAEICAQRGRTKTKVNRCLSEGRAALRQRGHLGEVGSGSDGPKPE
jgi:DNA-directed RNA polymerase specialized sigma24 family protein